MKSLLRIRSFLTLLQNLDIRPCLLYFILGLLCSYLLYLERDWDNFAISLYSTLFAHLEDVQTLHDFILCCWIQRLWLCTFSEENIFGINPVCLIWNSGDVHGAKISSRWNGFERFFCFVCSWFRIIEVEKFILGLMIWWSWILPLFLWCWKLIMQTACIRALIQPLHIYMNFCILLYLGLCENCMQNW